MKRVWSFINNMKCKSDMKNRIFIAIMITFNLVAGFVAWELVGRFFLSGKLWLICFMGYPAVIVGFFGSVLYLYNHEFR